MSLYTRISRLFKTNPTADRTGEQDSAPMAYAVQSTKVLTEEGALQISTVWACVRLLAETVASLPLMVYENEGDNRALAKDSILYSVLHHRPNSRMTSMEFRETMMLNLCLHGNAFARIERNTRGNIVALWPMSAQQMKVVIGSAGETVYLYETDKGEYPFESRDIFHVKLFGNGNIGLSPLEYARSSLGLTAAADEYSNKFYTNGGKPGGVLKIDQVLSKDNREKLRENFAAMHEGSENAHKLFLLEGGMSYQQIQINPEDAQMLQTRRFQIEDLCRWFGVPSFLVNDTEKTTTWGSGIEQMLLGFYQLNLRPYLTRWEQAIQNQLLTPQERRKYTVEFNFEGLLRASTEARAGFYSQMVNNGLMTRNEVRKKENLPQMDGDGANQLTVQTALTPIDKLGQEE